MRKKEGMQNPSEDPRIVYGDIIDHPRHRSRTRRPMSLYDRAAQFLAYDALVGFSDMIAEEERLTEASRTLDEDALALLNRELLRIDGEIAAGRRPCVTFTVFVPDARKAGGSYEQITDFVRQIDTADSCVVLESRSGRSGEYKRIELARIHAVSVKERAGDPEAE